MCQRAEVPGIVGTSHRFTLEDTERALTISQTDRSSLKAMVLTAHATQPGVTA